MADKKAVHEAQVRIAKDGGVESRRDLAQDPGVAPEAQLLLAKDLDAQTRCRLAENPGLMPALQVFLAQNSNHVTRCSLAKNPGLAPRVQAILARDGRDKVRRALARNPGLAPDLRAVLAKDKKDVGHSGRMTAMKKHRAASLLLGAVVAVALLLVFLRDVQRPAGADAVLADDTTGDTPSAKTARNAHSSLTVHVEAPRSGMLPVGVTANGSIAAWQEAVISSDMPDLRLVEVRADVGDVVDAQEVLAVFDDVSVKVAVAQAEAALAEARALAAEARENATRARSLEASGALSQQAILQYMTAAQSAEARVKANQARLQAERLRLERTQVRAPDRGIISSRNATVGAVSGLGGELFRMVRQGRIEWRAELTSSELERVPVGTPVTLTLPSGQTITGKVRTLAPTVNPANRAGLVYVDLPEESLARPGMFARGVFELGGSTGLTVPQQAVVMREAFNYVFTLDAERRVHQVKVTTGRRIGDRVEIVDGLDEKAAVVVTGAGFLNDGDSVRVAPVDMPAQKAVEQKTS
jgi:RND family efflux transporter MFP subunit